MNTYRNAHKNLNRQNVAYLSLFILDLRIKGRLILCAFLKLINTISSIIELNLVNIKGDSIYISTNIIIRMNILRSSRDVEFALIGSAIYKPTKLSTKRKEVVNGGLKVEIEFINDSGAKGTINYIRSHGVKYSPYKLSRCFNV